MLFFSILFLDWMLHYISARTALIIIFIFLWTHCNSHGGQNSAGSTSLSWGLLYSSTVWLTWSHIDNCSDMTLFLFSLCFSWEFCICVRAVLKLKTTTQHTGPKVSTSVHPKPIKHDWSLGVNCLNKCCRRI